MRHNIAHAKNTPGGGQLGLCLTAAARRPLPARRLHVAATLLPKRLHEWSTRRICPVAPYEPSLLICWKNLSKRQEPSLTEINASGAETMKDGRAGFSMLVFAS
jgi:hypothetical protein